jgi:hypothetical protein
MTRLTAVALVGAIALSCAPVWEEGRETPAGEKAERTVTLGTEVLRKRGNFWMVRFVGSISSSEPICFDSQEIVVQSRRPGAARWQAVGSDLTDEAGSYSFALEVHRAEDFRAVASRFEICERTESPTVNLKS